MAKLTYNEVKSKLSNEKIAGAIRLLKDSSMFKSACEVGIDKYFDKKTDINNFMYKLFLEVKSDPSIAGLHPDTIMEVDEAMKKRSIANKEIIDYENVADKLSTIKEADIKDAVMIGRNKASLLIDKKMNYLMKNKKALEKESLVNLAKVFGIFFDKSQIVQGQATENIAIMAKVDDNMTPEQAMDALLKTREKIMADKEN